jgi:hypothetical protein
MPETPDNSISALFFQIHITLTNELSLPNTLFRTAFSHPMSWAHLFSISRSVCRDSWSLSSSNVISAFWNKCIPMLKTRHTLHISEWCSFFCFLHSFHCEVNEIWKNKSHKHTNFLTCSDCFKLKPMVYIYGVHLVLRTNNNNVPIFH